MSGLRFIVNPNASNGRCGKLWRRRIRPQLTRLKVEHEVHLTRAGGDGTRLGRELAAGGGTVISVGGDGTHSEVVSGLWEAGLPNPDLRVGLLTLGTGGDFRRTLGLPLDPMAQLNQLLSDHADGRIRHVDVGRLTYVDHEGREAERAFINIASFGIGGEVDDRVNRTTKLFGGFASFLIGSVRATVGYRNRLVHLELDGEDLGSHRVFNVAVANGRYFGGGMHVAPRARPDDGLFDVVIMGDFGLRAKLRMAPLLYRGEHLDLNGVESHRGRVLVATSEETVLLDVDGEQPGRLPARFEILPEALALLGVEPPEPA